ncbi:RTA1 like protein [Punctularia strigosozonata HHB-11173 SS5]|uniref:RTA1 like protein n=1 Tax=Punctularia strigosozonata (strain HHB-11173) TaxID=741275 RepID=UPI00044171EE|nr:RTA1 like protein [Punctularia strigosozonata HHB-11173 SS5]EIN13774.1 RTA1 like protein [Punctularia strigosozonata HHB-11173 SS5]
MEASSFAATNATILAQTPPRHHSPYGYVPTLWICALFIALFGLSTLIHFGQAIYFRMWWLFPTAVLAGFTEIIGWSGRLWSSKNPLLLDPYLMQITTTIIAPTPLVAANFIILGRIIQRLGSEYSRLGPKTYTVVFLCFDFVALVVQAVGGASASRAAEQNMNPAKGGHIMLGGIVFQMVAISVYVACAGEFFMRFLAHRPVRKVQHESSETELKGQSDTQPVLDRKLQLMIIGLILSTTLIFIRSVYRTIELADGWTGRIIQTQVYFNVLDGGMITAAMFCLNFFHPGVLLNMSKRHTSHVA